MLISMPVQFRVPMDKNLFYAIISQDEKCRSFYIVRDGEVKFGTTGREASAFEMSRMLDWMQETFECIESECSNP